MYLVLVVCFLVCSTAYIGYSDCNLDCMVVHGSGGGGGGCTGGCCPCSTGTYAGAAFCNLQLLCGGSDGGGGI